MNDVTTEHDFSAIEQALKQNEAPMRMRERIGRGGRAALVASCCRCRRRAG